MGYHRAGFQVFGVDHEPQPRYPFVFTQMDALAYLGHVTAGDLHYDAIHASPPCQRWSSKTRDPEAHPDLITPLRPMLELAEVPYVIENVEGAPLVEPMQLCGSSFGLGVERHRLFETNFPLMVPPCAHGGQPRRFRVYDHGRWYLSRVVPMYGNGGGKAKGEWAKAAGIDWMTHEEMAEAIPPAYTELIGKQLLAHLAVAA